MSDDPPSRDNTRPTKYRIQRQPSEQVLTPTPELQTAFKLAAAIAHEAGQTTVGLEHGILALFRMPSLWPREQLAAAGWTEQMVLDALVRDVIGSDTTRYDPPEN
ncbi:hypothetical protein ACFYUD_36035 [Nocardia tengchongensis]|uniref:hypothetical protein n=1 Tax=Nocardia tengchongensis TaxID=2055889 RepID=UPI0036757141